MKYVHAGANKLFPVAQSFLQIAARFVEPSQIQPPGTASTTASPSSPSQTSITGKRKLHETSHQPLLDDDLRLGMEPMPSPELMMQYPPNTIDSFDMTLANFITWPSGAVGTLNVGDLPSIALSQSSIPPGQISVTAPPPVPSGYQGTQTSAGFEFMDTTTEAGAAGASAWANAGEFMWNAPALQALASGTYEAEFQDRVAIAAVEGPLGFDWFGWERWWEGEDGSSTTGGQY